jgi:hypothetical protein
MNFAVGITVLAIIGAYQWGRARPLRIQSIAMSCAVALVATLNVGVVSEFCVSAFRLEGRGNITVLAADGESSQDSSRLCSEEKGYLGNCILQPDPSGRVGFLIISLLIASTHAEFFKRPVARRPRARTWMRRRNLSDRRCISVPRFLI